MIFECVPHITSKVIHSFNFVAPQSLDFCPSREPTGPKSCVPTYQTSRWLYPLYPGIRWDSSPPGSSTHSRGAVACPCTSPYQYKSPLS